ncbi:DNA-processing protein DprA [Candidatus Kaiserbacteria bacterium]|nr:DNA-processing protein DprA [Candidatus Kaiserbacteria bacterium]
MNHPIHTLTTGDTLFPPLLREIPEPPQTLYYRGQLPPLDAKHLAVVGSRDYTSYAEQVVRSLIGGLRGHNIAIVSGLARGIDGLAHRAALDVGLYTLAVPGSGLNDSVLYPVHHRRLAQEILSMGGGLLSEFEPTFRATQWSFPKRNRIMAGLAHAVLVVEATQKSGTLITARLATDYNRDVLTVPGNIFSETTQGPHMLIRLGATPVTNPTDILEALHIEAAATSTPLNLSPEEAQVLTLLREPRNRDELIRNMNLPASAAGVLLMHLELAGHITTRPDGTISKTR